eukprot:scaffold210886_cov21-Tisochrysis_lutea.AAC.1
MSGHGDPLPIFDWACSSGHGEAPFPMDTICRRVWSLPTMALLCSLPNAQLEPAHRIGGKQV